MGKRSLLIAKGENCAVASEVKNSSGNVVTPLSGDYSEKYAVWGDSGTYHVAVGNVTKATVNDGIVWNGDNLTFTGTGPLLAVSGTSPDSKAMSAQPAFSGGYGVTSGAWDGWFIRTDLTYYNVWVCSVQVTSANITGVTGTGITGTVTYDPVENTLTLNGAQLEGVTDNAHRNAAIYADGDLAIELIGNNNSATGADAAGTNSSSGLSVTGSLTIFGSGSLTVASGSGWLAPASIPEGLPYQCLQQPQSPQAATQAPGAATA